MKAGAQHPASDREFTDWKTSPLVDEFLEKPAPSEGMSASLGSCLQQAIT